MNFRIILVQYFFVVLQIEYVLLLRFLCRPDLSLQMTAVRGALLAESVFFLYKQRNLIFFRFAELPTDKPSWQ